MSELQTHKGGGIYWRQALTLSIEFEDSNSQKLTPLTELEKGDEITIKGKTWVVEEGFTMPSASSYGFGNWNIKLKEK
ncbi:MAG: hypothetical protein AAF378_05180 [Cyanobacteria bacterium P01_A01_bin.84]